MATTNADLEPTDAGRFPRPSRHHHIQSSDPDQRDNPFPLHRRPHVVIAATGLLSPPRADQLRTASLVQTKTVPSFADCFYHGTLGPRPPCMTPSMTSSLAVEGRGLPSTGASHPTRVGRRTAAVCALPETRADYAACRGVADLQDTNRLIHGCLECRASTASSTDQPVLVS